MTKLLTALLLSLMLAGCGGAVPNPGPVAPAPPRPDSVDAALVQATDHFALSLLKAVHAGKEPGENLFLSPTSAQVILSLTANGARGETQAEMLAALGYGDLALTAINEANQALRGILADPDPKVQLSIANAIWHQKGKQVAAEFESVATQQYGAQVNETDFAKPKAADAINRWVSNQTQGRIPKLVDKTDSSAVMWLVNAIYFKGDWQKPFKAHATYDQPFNRLDGSQKQIPFMHQTDAFHYLKAEGITGVRLPYGDGGLSFYAFMPDQWEGFVEGLMPEQYQGWLSAMEVERIRLSLPKVKLTDEAELAEPLVAMGMAKAFDRSQADLSGLFTDGQEIFISRVIQKTFLEINEKGTEAAAATGVEAVPTSAPVQQPPDVVLDHPFLLSIRDDRTGVTLFMGAVLEP